MGFGMGERMSQGIFIERFGKVEGWRLTKAES